jgi:FkbH-like protein
MQWLLPAQDFRGELRTAQQVPQTAQRLVDLTLLARHRLSFLEAIQLNRVLDTCPVAEAAGVAQVRLAILSSNTTEHLVPGIRIAALRRGMLAEVHTGAYGQYRQELADRASPLHAFAPQVVLFSLSAQEAVTLARSSGAVDEALEGWLDELQQLWAVVQDRLGAVVIQQTFLDFSEPLFGSFDALVPTAPATVVARLNERLVARAARCGVHLLDAAAACRRDGRDRWFDMNRWLQAKQEIAPQAALSYGELMARVIAALRGLSRKCLVLDLDNTLWGGVVGDDGIDGIVIGQGNATGEAHLALQRYASQLRERGIILAVCSKNEPEVAAAAVAQHPDMLLRPADFAAFVANWDDKATNLQRIAAQLNIDLSSMVFVDDNPAERARVRTALPTVAVPELPADVAGYVRCIADAGYFEAVAFTTDDSQRASQYSANSGREALRKSAQSMDDYLRDLDMQVEHAAFQTVDFARITQLINKTNQFNLTTRRYMQQEVAALQADPRNLTLQFRLTDRFGDNGLVSALVLRPAANGVDASGDLLEIDTWIMSCRVFGRQLEHEAMNLTVAAARGRGTRFLLGTHIPTAKNAVVADLYARLGFTPVVRTEQTRGAAASQWLLRLDEYRPTSTAIRHLTPARTS